MNFLENGDESLGQDKDTKVKWNKNLGKEIALLSIRGTHFYTDRPQALIASFSTFLSCEFFLSCLWPFVVLQHHISKFLQLQLFPVEKM